ncbi:MAG: HWE histidine kinase domain-containing protein, partial [Pseudomonadota bacterium]
TEKIGGRIHALARAHDQITQVHWAPASLQTLLKTEGEAYLSDKADRLRIGGDDVLLKPSAFSTMSLVVHELLTNSCKYGALSDSTGHIDVKLARNGDGDLLVDWRDVGGPKVKPPARKGFGTTIIERSIPFELDGDATIEFPPTGVEAAFRIPASFVVDGEVEASAPVSRKDRNAAAFSGNVLILEDNMIIAMDVEDIVTKHGAQTVDIASRVAEALTLIEEKDFTFAMLDVNLGSETSEAVADELVTRGVPFAFATGYGDAHEIADRFPNAAVLQKPIDEAALMQAIAGS